MGRRTLHERILTTAVPALVIGGCATLLGIEEGEPVKTDAGIASGDASDGPMVCPEASAPPHVYTGSAVLEDGVSELPAAQLCLNRSHSLLFFGVRHDLDRPASALVRGELDDSGGLRFTRGEASGRVDLSWQVLEHPDIKVRHGFTVLDGEPLNGSSSKTVVLDLTADQEARTFPVISYAVDPDDQWQARHHVSASIPSNIDLRLEARDKGAQVAWQVVTLPVGSSVQKGTRDFDGAPQTNQLVKDHAVSPVVPSELSFLLFTQHALDDVPSTPRQWAFDGRLVNPNSADGGVVQVSFARAEANANFRIQWFLAQLAPGFGHVQQALVLLSPSFYSDNPETQFEAIDGNRSLVLSSTRGYQAGVLKPPPTQDGGTDGALTASASGDVSFTMEFSGSRPLLRRESALSEVRIYTQVVSF